MRLLVAVWVTMSGMGIFVTNAHAQQDLIVVRSMPTTSGTTASTITYEISYKNGGAGSANGATITEQLPNGFQVLNLSCVGAFGGAVCPATTIVNNDPANFPFPRIEGTISTFPEFGVVRLRVQMKLSANPGSYNLSGTIVGPSADPITGTNQVLSSLYVRPLLLDLTTSHSSNLPVIGGSNGQGGVTNVVLDGNTIGSHIPLSVSYRIENLGPDTAPGGAFHWRVAEDGFRGWVSTSWTQATYGEPVGYESYRNTWTDPNTGTTYTEISYDDARITPYTCTAIGSAVCPAPVLYRVNEGWLSRTPQVNSRTIIGDTQQPTSYYYDPFSREIASADVQEARQNKSPLFGQDLAAGAGLILTATLTNPRYGEYTESSQDPATGQVRQIFVPRDGMFTQTNQMSMSRCHAGVNENGSTYLASSISYSDPDTGMPLASVSDNDLGNNELFSSLNTTRDCPEADISVTASAAVNGVAGNVVYDGDSYAMTYTISNNGPSSVTGLEIESYVNIGGSYQGTAFSQTNWNGFTRTVSCTSSNPAGSPCPSQSALNTWMAAQGNVSFASPLASGSTWTIVVSGNAGTTGCTAGTNYSYIYWLGNLRAWGVAMADPNEGNNYAVNSDRSLTFIPQGCPTAPNKFSIWASKTPLSADTTADAVNVGDYASFSLTMRNDSPEGIALKDVYFNDYPGARYYQPSGAYASVDMTAFNEFQREPGQPAGLDIQVTAWNPATQMDEVLPPFPSGIVCIAHGTAQCPSMLKGTSTSMDAAQIGSYNQFFGTVPLLPSGAANFLEFITPWRALPDANGCSPVGNTGRSNYNYLSMSLTGETKAVLADGSEVLANTLQSNGYSTAVGVVYNNLTPCPTGTVSGGLQKTLSGHGAGNANGSTMSYDDAVANGDTLSYSVVMTNTGSLGVNQYTFTDSKAVPMCRDGIRSNPSGVVGQARCGEALLTNLTCSSSGGAICPSTAQISAAVNAANANPNTYFEVSVGTIGNYAAPSIPPGGMLTFNTSYTVSGLNSFTGAINNNASYRGQSGRDSFSTGAEVQLNIPQAAGISMSKDVDKLQVGEGEVVTYTIDITNGGNGPLAAGASFEDPLPAGLAAFVSVSCEGKPGPAALPANGPGICPATITNNGSGLSAILPAMPANTMLSFTVTASAPTGGVITSVGNEARVTIPGTTPVSLLASANFAIPSAKETAQASPMVGVKSVRNATSGGNSVLPGEQLIYTISYANVGGMDIANFQIAETLPSYVTYSGGATVATVGPISTGSLNSAFNGTSDTNLLAPGAILGGAGAMTITLPVTVNAGVSSGTVISNQANASGSGVTGNVPTDNVDNSNPACPAAAPAPCLPIGVSVPSGSVQQPQTSTVDPVLVGVGTPATNPGTTASMTGVKSVRNATSGGNSVLPGEQLIYTISYANVEDTDITNFQITETLPSYVSYNGGATVATFGSGISTGMLNSAFNGTSDINLLTSGAVLGGKGVMTITLPVTVNAGVSSGTVISNQANGSGSGVTGSVPTDNVDNSNPTCPTATPALCLPAGVTVPAGSVLQTQAATIDPVHVSVGSKPVAATPVPANSTVLLLLLSLLVPFGARSLGARKLEKP